MVVTIASRVALVMITLVTIEGVDTGEVHSEIVRPRRNIICHLSLTGSS